MKRPQCPDNDPNDDLKKNSCNNAESMSNIENDADCMRLRGGEPPSEPPSHCNIRYDNILRPERSIRSKHRSLKEHIIVELAKLYDLPRINKKREYLLLFASCVLDWLALHRGACDRSWSHKIGDLFNSFVATKRGVLHATQRVDWKYSYKLLRHAVDSNDLSIVHKVSCLQPQHLNKHMVYAMVNLKHKKFYVGRTNNLLRRLSEHFRDALKHQREGTPTERVHAYMAHTDILRWTMCPIFSTNNILADVKLAETRMIKALGRNRLLNDDFHTRARNHLLTKKSKTFNRSNRSKTHRERKPGNIPRAARGCSYLPTQFIVRDTSDMSQVEVHSYDICAIFDWLHKWTTKLTIANKRIFVHGTFHGLSNWKRIRLLYGQSAVASHTNGEGENTDTDSTPTLTSLLKHMKSGNTQEFSLSSVLKTEDKYTTDILERVGKSKRAAKRICHTGSLYEVLRWRAKVHLVHNKKLRAYAACNIEKHLKEAWHLNYNKPIVMRIPFSPNLSLHAIRAEALRLIDTMQTEPTFAVLLKRRLRVVFTKRTSIESYVSNHKKYCKTYKHETHAKCVCDNFKALPKVNGHIAFKATDTNNTLIAKCLHGNAKNILSPTDVSSNEDIANAFENLITTLSQVHNYVFGNEEDNLRTEIKTRLESFHVTVKANLNKLSSILPNVHDIRKFKRKYKGLVCCPLDKNTGCMFLCCPCYHEQALRTTYTENKAYSKSAKTALTILDRWETFYDKNNYSKWYNYPTRVEGDDSNLPTGYILPKNKDIKKTRPIVSYFKHPFKRVLNSAGRALLHILECTKEPHFNMSNVSDLMPRVEKINKKYTHDNGTTCNLACVCLNGDLANMYTSLDHGSIRKAVQWLLDSVRSSSRRSEVSVPAFKMGEKAHLGRSGESDSKRINFTFDELINVIKFDLKNSYFKIGDRILQQRVGIPMGSPLSPALAQIVCAYYEAQTLANAARDGITNPVEGIRYVDDLTALIYYDPAVPASKVDAEELARRIQNGYHPNMDLEVENTDMPFKFLSSILRVNKNKCKITSRFHNKNKKQIKQGKPQLFPTYQHYHSHAPARQKMSVVISSIHRIGNACSSHKAAQNAFNIISRELRCLKYPEKIISSALRRVRNKDQRWHAISMLPEHPNPLVRLPNHPGIRGWPARRRDGDGGSA